jgi:hypothetical protein
MTKLQDLTTLLNDLNNIAILYGSKTILKLSFAYGKIGVLKIDLNGNVLDQLRSHCYTKKQCLDFLLDYRLGLYQGISNILNSPNIQVIKEDQK